MTTQSKSSNTSNHLLIAIVLILTFPFWIGLLGGLIGLFFGGIGAAFGLVFGIIGGFFGIIGSIIGGAFSIVTWPFHMPSIFWIIAVIAVIYIIRSRKL
jgi:hypothetical protein